MSAEVEHALREAEHYWSARVSELEAERDAALAEVERLLKALTDRGIEQIRD